MYEMSLVTVTTNLHTIFSTLVKFNIKTITATYNTNSLTCLCKR